MWKAAFKGIYLLHALLLMLSAIGLFRFWARTRFWLPKYVHVIAVIGFAVMLWVLSVAPADAPVSHWGPVPRFLLSLSLPAIVYFFFVVYGGQRVAFDRSVATQAACPFCGEPVRAYPASSNESAIRFLDPECPHCGQTLTS